MYKFDESGLANTCVYGQSKSGTASHVAITALLLSHNGHRSIHSRHPCNPPSENLGYRPAFYMCKRKCNVSHLLLTFTIFYVGQLILFPSAVVTIGFNTAAYTLLEDAGSVNITASILNGTLARNGVVTLSTESDGTATGKFNILQPGEKITLSYTSPAGIDYIDTTITLMFDATISTQMVTVLVLDDNVVEDTEFINLALRSVDSAVILNPATARINIEDINSKLMEGKYSHVIIPSYLLCICHNYN